MFTLSAIWGVALGFIFRNTVIVIMFHVLYLMGVEATLMAIFPSVAKWLPNGTQSAVIDDITLPQRLDMLSGTGLYLLWILALFAIATIVAVEFNQSALPSLTNLVSKRFSFKEIHSASEKKLNTAA